MKNESTLSEAVLAEFQKSGHGTRLQVMSEAYSPHLLGGATRLVFLLDGLEVRCIGHVGELTIEVKTPWKKGDWWESGAYLYAYLERVNSIDDVLNTMVLIKWMANNWEKVSDLLLDSTMSEERKKYEAFAANLHKERSEAMIKFFRDQKKSK